MGEGGLGLHVDFETCALMHDLHFMKIVLCFVATGVETFQVWDGLSKLIRCVLRGVKVWNHVEGREKGFFGSSPLFLYNAI